MAEPIQTSFSAVSLMTLAIAIFGPQAGPYMVILLGSIGGGLWALSSVVMASKMEGVWLMMRCIITAIVLTSILAQFIGPYIGIAVGEAYAVVSFVIGALGNKWLEIFDTIKIRIQGFVSTGGRS